MDKEDLSFLEKEETTDLFKEIDSEKKKKELELHPTTNDEFINSLPDWDLPPLYDKVRRVNHQ